MSIFKEKTFVQKHSNVLVAAATVIGSGIAAYFGSRKATTEIVTKAAQAIVDVAYGVGKEHASCPKQVISEEDSADITDAIADAIEEKAKANAEAEPAPSEAKTEEVKAEENK